MLFGGYSFDCSKKHVLWNIISEKYPDIQWQFDKNGELKDENFDASDSLVCVMGYVNKIQFGDDEPRITKTRTAQDGKNTFIVEYTTSFCGKDFNHRLEV